MLRTQLIATAALTGGLRLTELLDRYGADTVEDAIGLLKTAASQQMRAKISTIADGDYEATAIVDSDGVVDRAIEINLVTRKRGGDRRCGQAARYFSNFSHQRMGHSTKFMPDWLDMPSNSLGLKFENRHQIDHCFKRMARSRLANA